MHEELVKVTNELYTVSRRTSSLALWSRVSLVHLPLAAFSSSLLTSIFEKQKSQGGQWETVDLPYQQRNPTAASANRSFLSTSEAEEGKIFASFLPAVNEWLGQFEGEGVLAPGGASSGLSSLCCRGALCFAATRALFPFFCNCTYYNTHHHLIDL